MSMDHQFVNLIAHHHDADLIRQPAAHTEAKISSDETPHDANFEPRLRYPDPS